MPSAEVRVGMLRRALPPSRGLCVSRGDSKPCLGGEGLCGAYASECVVHRLTCAGNLVRLLSWWTPPPEVEKPVEMGVCDWCKKSFPLREGEFFTKFTFQYCG
jgi:hypothetical protein